MTSDNCMVDRGSRNIDSVTMLRKESLVPQYDGRRCANKVCFGTPASCLSDDDIP